MTLHEGMRDWAFVLTANGMIFLGEVDEIDMGICIIKEPIQISLVANQRHPAGPPMMNLSRGMFPAKNITVTASVIIQLSDMLEPSVTEYSNAIADFLKQEKANKVGIHLASTMPKGNG